MREGEGESREVGGGRGREPRDWGKGGGVVTTRRGSLRAAHPAAVTVSFQAQQQQPPPPPVGTPGPSLVRPGWSQQVAVWRQGRRPVSSKSSVKPASPLGEPTHRPPFPCPPPPSRLFLFLSCAYAAHRCLCHAVAVGRRGKSLFMPRPPCGHEAGLPTPPQPVMAGSSAFLRRHPPLGQAVAHTMLETQISCVV